MNILVMKILNKELADRFIIKHADAIKPVDRWIEQMEKSVFSNHNELKAAFPSADYIGNSRYVFNIKGNNYRLVAVVLFTAGMITICYMGTHTEYDKIDCLTVLQ
jgi:mRNA interferase HigB